MTGANVPLGLGLIAAGAVGLAHVARENWGWITANVKQALSSLMMVLSGAMFGVGAVLAFSGVNVPLGLGLMAAGLLTAGNVAALTWNDLPKKVRYVIAAIDAGVGLGMTAIGAVLAFSGVSVAGGLALMAAGLATTGLGAKLGWDGIPAKIKSALTETALYLSLGMATLGAVLAFSGVATPLGLGIMALGLGTLAANTVLNWDSISTEMRNSISAVAVVLGAALTTIGAILAFSGVAMPLGIGLIAAGLASSGTAIALNWSAIKIVLKESVDEIALFIGTATLVLGAILAFSGVALPLGIGLMAVGAASLGTAAVLNWGRIREYLGMRWEQLGAYISGGSLVLGALLAFTGVNIPLGIALMAAGGVGLMAAANIDWNSVPKKIGEAWENVKEKFANGKKDLETDIASIKASWESIVSKTVTLTAKVKNEADTWWFNVKTWWSEKVTTPVVEFSASVKDDSATWWENVQTWWSSKVGAVEDFTTNLKNDSVTWWSNLTDWWNTKIATPVSSFVTNVQDDSATWWSNVTSWWSAVSASSLSITASIVNDAATWWENVKTWWNGVVGTLWTTLNIKLPHVTVTWSADPWFGLIDVPTFNIAWYAKGGIFDDPSIIGVGENGKEAVVPLENNTEWISKIADQLYSHGDFSSESTSDAVENAETNIVTAVYAIGDAIVNAVNAIANSGGGYSFDRFAREMTSWQRRQVRAVG